MVIRLAKSALVVIAALCLPALLAHVVATSHEPGETPASQGDDDGWRLTKQGWEKLSPRVFPVRVVPRVIWPAGTAPELTGASSQHQKGWDMHPGTLALLLVVAAITPFCLFPNERNVAGSRRSQTLF